MHGDDAVGSIAVGVHGIHPEKIRLVQLHRGKPEPMRQIRAPEHLVEGALPLPGRALNNVPDKEAGVEQLIINETGAITHGGGHISTKY